MTLQREKDQSDSSVETAPCTKLEPAHMATSETCFEPRQSSDTPFWQQHIWRGALLILTIVLLILLAVVWHVSYEILNIISGVKLQDNAFVLSGISLVSMTQIRMVAILGGIAISAIGLAVSFYTHDRETSVSGRSSDITDPNLKWTLATYSPGIVGVIAGTIIIMTAVIKTTTQNYQGPTVREYRAQLEKDTSPIYEATKGMRPPRKPVDAQ